ncbi:hypothetical protein Tco_0746258 [Tanacetum coccineum]
MTEFGDSPYHENAGRRMMTPEEEESYPWEKLKSSDVDVCRAFLNLCPFKMGKFRETLAEGAKGALHLGPERDRVFADLTPEEKERFKADIHAMNIILQGLPKDIYILINHYTNAKDIWDNVKMLLEAITPKFVNNMLPEWVRFMTVVKLNRGLKQFNYDQLYAYLKQHEAYANENMMMLERYNQHAIDPLAFGRQNRGQGNYARGAVTAGNGGVQNRVGNANPEDTLEIAEKTRIGMLEKMKSTLWVDSKIKIASPDYSKENYLATIYTPYDI